MTEDIFVFEMCADYRIGRLRMLPDFSLVGVAELCVCTDNHLGYFRLPPDFTGQD